MSQTHCNLIYHLVFSTKERRPYLTPDIRADVHRYLAGAIQGADGIPLKSTAPTTTSTSS
jgi:REP element-mobilizing transposase RayT